MGFLDKAKKMAEQAQAKLDEAQKQFNQPGQQQQPTGPIVEYDKHGRPIPQEQSASASAPPPAAPPAAPMTPPPATPTADMPAAPAPTPSPMPAAPAPVVAPAGAEPVEETVGSGAAETAPGPPPHDAAAAAPGAQDVPQDRNHPSYEPPKMSSGDPLAG